MDYEQQAQFILNLRKRGIANPAVLEAMLTIPRAQFIPDKLQHLAIQDGALEIGHGQTISQPSLVARMTMELDLDKQCRVLEIGTGSGYQTAILAKLAKWVYTIERIRAFVKPAEQRFLDLRLNNIATLWADGFDGWSIQSPFDRIILTAAASKPPHTLSDQLAEGGIMIFPFGEEGNNQQLIKVEKQKGQLKETVIGEVRFVPIKAGITHE